MAKVSSKLEFKFTIGSETYDFTEKDSVEVKTGDVERVKKEIERREALIPKKKEKKD